MSKAKYYLYRNLHTGGFSVKHKGLVCARGDAFVMKNVEFRVSQAGSSRAKRKQQRNVHAFMVADNYETRSKFSSRQLSKMIKITYHPYKYDTFVIAETEEPIMEAEYAIAFNGQVFVECSGS